MKLPQRRLNETHVEWLYRCQQALNDSEHPSQAEAWDRLGWIPKADVADKIRAHALGVML